MCSHLAARDGPTLYGEALAAALQRHGGFLIPIRPAHGPKQAHSRQPQHLRFPGWERGDVGGIAALLVGMMAWWSVTFLFAQI